MPEFGATSKNNLKTCHPDIKRVLNKAIEIYDFTVLEGYREKDRQNYLYSIGRSTKQFPDSNHNTIDKNGEPLSNAVDVVPYPAGWKATKRQWYIFAGLIIGIAYSMGIKIIWGRDWDSDYIFDDQIFNDYAHFQLEGETR